MASHPIVNPHPNRRAARRWRRSRATAVQQELLCLKDSIHGTPMPPSHPSMYANDPLKILDVPHSSARQ